MATMMSDPTIALATPAPSLWPTPSCGVGWVKKSRLSALKPWTTTVKTISARIGDGEERGEAADADHQHVDAPTAARPPIDPSEA